VAISESHISQDEEKSFPHLYLLVVVSLQFRDQLIKEM
jgi:hypothetical protein